jgi:hypothetical protein
MALLRQHWGVLAPLDNSARELKKKYATPLRAFLAQWRKDHALHHEPPSKMGPPVISLATNASKNEDKCGAFVLQKDTDFPGGDIG